MKTLVQVYVLTSILLAMTACRNNPPITSSPALFFPQQKETPNAYMEALLTGKLVLVGSCLRIEDDEDSNYLPIWPKGFSVRVEGDEILVIDVAGTAIAQAGDQVKISGGEVPIAARYLAKPLPESCPGPYWLVGYEVSK